jgi:hypothetical protein
MSQEAAPLIECSSESPRSLRDDVRRKLDGDIELFLKQGGTVKKIDNDVRADPPRKPTMNYGSAPI